MSEKIPFVTKEQLEDKYWVKTPQYVEWIGMVGSFNSGYMCGESEFIKGKIFNGIKRNFNS